MTLIEQGERRKERATRPGGKEIWGSEKRRAFLQRSWRGWDVRKERTPHAGY